MDPNRKKDKKKESGRRHKHAKAPLDYESSAYLTSNYSDGKRDISGTKLEYIEIEGGPEKPVRTVIQY